MNANLAMSAPPSPTSDSPPPSPTSHSRGFPIYLPDFDYDLFHLTLYYLYTDRLLFVDDPAVQFDPEVPATADAEGIYEMGVRLLIPPLRRKAIHFLSSTCTMQNITAKTFGIFASRHGEIEELYDSYFNTHWDEVLHSNEFEEFFQELEQRFEENPKEYIRTNAKLRKMLRNHK